MKIAPSMNRLEKSALSVGSVSFFLAHMVKDHIGPLVIRGEISNLRLTSLSSYVHFSLRDATSKIECLMPTSIPANLVLQQSKNGDEVLVLGQAKYYAKHSQISFFVKEILKLGRGELSYAGDLLKEKLTKEGFLAKKSPRSWSQYPERIGVITSKDGAALQDIIRTAQNRYPLTLLCIFPSLVQGNLAKEQLLRALIRAFEYHQENPLDVLIISRGGGDSEQLEVFNNEELIRLISQSEIPTITAIGHETDKTLADYASDISVSTPTAAAMVALPDKEEIVAELQQAHVLMYNLMKNMFNIEKSKLKTQKEKLLSLYTM